MSEGLKLKDSVPLAKGHSRLVFQHPQNTGWLVKVIRPDVIEQRWGGGAAWYKRSRRYGRFISYVREVQEYVVGCVATGTGPNFFQKVVGFADTDLGLGLVVEAVRGPDGQLAPTLRDLIRKGCYGSGTTEQINVFARRLLASDVTISDLNLGNLVYTGGYDGDGEFVLIDGLGTSTLFPLKSFSRWLNRRSKAGRIKRLNERIERLLKRPKS